MVSLVKGGNVNLSKEAPGLNKVFLGLGWDVSSESGEFDLDAIAFLLGEDGKVISDDGIVYFNHLKSKCGSIVHQGDNLTGEGEGDDEIINVDLSLVPAEVKRITIAVVIHDAKARKQNFGQVDNAMIRVVNADDDKELAKYDLTEDASADISMIFGELYRHNDDWKFKAIGKGSVNDLQTLATEMGVKS